MEVEVLSIPVLMLLLMAAPHNELEEEVFQQESSAAPYTGEEKGKPVSQTSKDIPKDMKAASLEHQAVLTRKLRPRIMADAPMGVQAPTNPLNDANAAMFETYNPQVFSAPNGKQAPRKMETVPKQKSYFIAIPATSTATPSVFLEKRGAAVSDASALVDPLSLTDGEGHSDGEEDEDEEDFE